MSWVALGSAAITAGGQIGSALLTKGGDGGGSIGSLVNVPDFQRDSLFDPTQDYLNEFSTNMLAGNLPDYFKPIGEYGGKELEGILNVTLPGNLVEEVIKVEEGHFDVHSSASNAYDLMKILNEEAGIYHLSTITGIEREGEFHVCYHIQHRIEEEFREVPINFTVTKIDKKNPKTPSMIDFFVAADYYEREIYDFSHSE